MANSWIHAKSSARRFGGDTAEYLEIHQFFDRTKSAWADTRHRAVLHHTFGVELAVELFGRRIGNATTRELGQQHLEEDCSRQPTADDWLRHLARPEWFATDTLRTPWQQCDESARRFGGVPEDFYFLHAWFDRAISQVGNLLDTAILHNSFGIFLGEQRFGPTVRLSTGKEVPTRILLERHVVFDLQGRIPTLEDWFSGLTQTEWMIKGAKPLSRILEEQPA